MEHVPVLREEVKKYLGLGGGEKVVDTTLGLGGHSSDILKSIGESGVLYAFDQDKRNLEEAKSRLSKHKAKIHYINDNFRYLKSRVTEEVDRVFFDLGISSVHVDEADRGFSFMQEGPLDMRYDPGQKLTAADVVNAYSEQDLARIFWEYGEERMGKKLARHICEERKNHPFESTTDLAEFIADKTPKQSRTHPATKIFQAIRIEVNDELNALKEGLEGAFEITKSGGRILIISYHSLEDRIVKRFFKQLERPEATGEQAIYSTHGEPLVESLTKKPVTPTEEEITNNPRSRSAKLRVYKKL